VVARGVTPAAQAQLLPRVANPNPAISRPVRTATVTIFVNLPDHRDNEWQGLMSSIQRRGKNGLFFLRSLFHKTVYESAIFQFLEGSAAQPTEHTTVRHVWSRRKQVKPSNSSAFFRIIGRYYNSHLEATIYPEIADACLNDRDTLFQRGILKSTGEPYTTLFGTIKQHIKVHKLYDNAVHDRAIVEQTMCYIGTQLVLREAFSQRSFSTAYQPDRPENGSVAPSQSKLKRGGRTDGQ